MSAKSSAFDPSQSAKIDTAVLEWYILPKKVKCLVCEGLYRHSLFILSDMTKS